MPSTSTTISGPSAGTAHVNQGEKYLQTQSQYKRRIQCLPVYRPLCDEVLENLGSHNRQQNQESNLKNDAQGIGLSNQ